MAKSVFTGWRTVTPGKCSCCGFDDGWSCDGRGAVLCDCQACAECEELSAEGFHAHGCSELEEVA